MKVVTLKDHDIEAWHSFNKRAYPERGQPEEANQYRFFKNPINSEAYKNVLVAKNNDDEIVGQILLLPTEFHYRGKKHSASWGMDYIVDEAHRGSPLGVILAKKAIRNRFHFGVGLAEMSLKVHLSLREKHIGYFSKYIRFRSIFSPLIFIVNLIFKIKDSLHSLVMPDHIKTNHGEFNRLTDPESMGSERGFWLNDVLEFSRDNQFNRWRFFHYPDKYFVYKFSPVHKESSINPTWFVLRPIIWKNTPCLLLVDFRFETLSDFDEILLAANHVLRQSKANAILTGNSLSSAHKVLGNHSFISFGEKKGHVVTNFFNSSDCKDSSYKSDEIMITFADSDLDFFYGNNSHW